MVNNLGCIDACGGVIQTGFESAEAGIFRLVIPFNGRLLEKEVNLLFFEPINFDTAGIPQDYYFEADIFSPSGVLVGGVTFKLLWTYSI